MTTATKTTTKKATTQKITAKNPTTSKKANDRKKAVATVPATEKPADSKQLNIDDVNKEIAQKAKAEPINLPAEQKKALLTNVNLVLNNISQKAMEAKYLAIDIAIDIYWLHFYKAHELMGLKSVEEIAEHNFGFKKSSTYNMINVIDRFGKRLEPEADNAVNQPDVIGIQDDYKGYCISQLIVMIKLTDEQIKGLGITPGMSVREIKKAVKSLESPSTSDSDSGNNESNKTNKTKSSDNDINVDSVTLQQIISFKNLEEYEMCNYYEKVDVMIRKALKSGKEVKIHYIV
ncbi:MAG: hypothetical protein FWE14_00030 [Lachnospiraceae bacterium]|nr:hypothetical protein [Lachnospiraceae bacterium]